MNEQRRDLIAGARRTGSEPTQCYECGNDIDRPFTCYCDDCEPDESRQLLREMVQEDSEGVG